MTAEQILTIINPFLPVTQVQNLPYNSSITWNYSLGNIAQLTLSGSPNINVINAPSNSFGMIQLTQGSGSPYVPNLSGSTPTTIAYSSNPGGLDIVQFYYNGQNYYWSLFANYGTVIYPTIQLGAPASFSLSVQSANQINLSWASVPSASTYIVKRTLDPAYVTGVTTLSTSGSTSYIDATLSGSTTYYYEVAASAYGYLNSNYTTASATTQVSNNPVFLTWNNLGASQLEQFNSNQGIRRQASPNTSSASYALSSTTLTPGQFMQYRIDSPLSNVSNVFLASSSGDTNNTSLLSINLNTTVKTLANFVQTMFGSVLHVAADGDMVRVQYTDGTLFMEYSTDGGTTWYTNYISGISPVPIYQIGSFPVVAGFGQSVIFTQGAPLSPPKYYQVYTQPGGTAVNHVWQPVVSASAYLLQRSVSASYNGAVTVYSGSNTYFQDTVSNNTAYWYRLQASSSLNTSAYATWNVNTTASGDVLYARWNYSGSQNEPGPYNKGIRRIQGFNAAYPQFCYTSQSITASQAFVFDIDSQAADVFNIAVNSFTGSTPVSGAMEFIMNFNGKFRESGSTVVSGITVVAGTMFRIAYHTGSFFTADSSSNSGSTWSTLFTSSITHTGSYYLGFSGTGVNTGPNNVSILNGII